MKESSKIATTQISLKLGESIVIWSTKQSIKCFGRAVSRLTSSGQIDIQIHGRLWKKARKNHDPSDFAQTL